MADQVVFISGYSDATPRSFVTTEDWAAILHTSSPVRNQDDENDISRLNGKLIVACENIDAQQDTIDAQQGRYYRCAARHHQCSTGNHRYPARKDSDRQKQAEKTQEKERGNVGGAVKAARGERKDEAHNR